MLKVIPQGKFVPPRSHQLSCALTGRLLFEHVLKLEAVKLTLL